LRFIFTIIHDFAEIAKNLARSENNCVVWNRQNNYVGNSRMMSNAKNFDILATLSVLHNYFDGLTKLFLNLYLAKFLDISAKSFFTCRKIHIYFYVYIKITIYVNCMKLFSRNPEYVNISTVLSFPTGYKGIYRSCE